MKKTLLLSAFLASWAVADEPIMQAALTENTAQCREWAVMDSIDAESMDDYMEQCLSNLGYQESDVEAYDYSEASADDESLPVNE